MPFFLPYERRLRSPQPRKRRGSIKSVAAASQLVYYVDPLHLAIPYFFLTIAWYAWQNAQTTPLAYNYTLRILVPSPSGLNQSLDKIDWCLSLLEAVANGILYAVSATWMNCIWLYVMDYIMLSALVYISFSKTRYITPSLWLTQLTRRSINLYHQSQP